MFPCLDSPCLCLPPSLPLTECLRYKWKDNSCPDQKDSHEKGWKRSRHSFADMTSPIEGYYRVTFISAPPRSWEISGLSSINIYWVPVLHDVGAKIRIHLCPELSSLNSTSDDETSVNVTGLTDLVTQFQ